MKRLGLLILLGAAAWPGAAVAGTASVADGELRYTAQPAEKNFLYVSLEEGAVVLEENNVSAPIEAGEGCTRDPGPAKAVRCPAAAVQRIVADLGSGDDRFTTYLPPAAPGLTLAGGAGRDVVLYAVAEGVTVTVDGIANDGGKPADDNILPDVEGVSGTGAADRLTAAATGGNLFGLSGRDTLTGGAGDDTIESLDPIPCDNAEESGCEDAAADTVECGGGDDVADADRRDRVARDCEVVAVDSRIALTRRGDRFTAFRSGLVVKGGAGRDRLSTGAFSVTIDGGAGNDRIRGGATSSRLIGGRGRDVITSDEEFDEILVRDGEVDRVTCGGGRDFVTADRRDKIAKDCRQVDRG